MVYTFEVDFGIPSAKADSHLVLLPPSQIVWRFGHFTHIKKCN